MRSLIPVQDALLEQSYQLCHVVELSLLQHIGAIARVDKHGAHGSAASAFASAEVLRC